MLAGDSGGGGAIELVARYFFRELARSLPNPKAFFLEVASHRTLVS